MKDPRILGVRGQAELEADRPLAAIETLRRLAEARPAAVEVQILLAKAYDRGGEYDKAAAALDAAYKLDPSRLETRVARDRFAFLRPDPKEDETKAAVADIVELAKAHPNDARVAELRGLVAWYLRREDAALALLEAAHAALGTSDSAVTLADFQWRADQRDAAFATLSDWLSIHPGDNYARVQLAELQLKAKDWEGAARNLQLALEGGAQRYQLEGALVWSLVSTGRVAAAEPYAQEAYTRSPGDPVVQYSMGRVYLDQGKAADAVSLLRGAANAFPDNRRIQLDYARALVATGQREAARKLLDAMLQGEEPFEERDEASDLRARLPN